ncbi:TerY-C metal binding domain-containing protein [Thorsellia anophelis]|uniref:Uncharacterized conserved protein YegL, contains vWA domain of TerY type n=1 Tax=Thorsellia anophelis DSM 18579 TaxID=1123402 RepID=A0A1I0ENZ4_9GAMM|nr:TerY-C metal binding domain-containing protein [Thorsellia anophelis]SET47009.1 Uncharacterized conserved protein YegL, contains vWA domain of TerY type [Thorsellia anophelis DSM 18579]
MRRLPIFIVADVSESMAGEAIMQLQDGIELLVRTLRSDPYALETAYVSVIAFAGQAKTLSPLVELPSFFPPRLPVGSGTALGNVLEHLMHEIDTQIIRTTAEKKGDFKPLVFLMTDGRSTDDPSEAIKKWTRFYDTKVNLVVIGLGPYANLEQLVMISPHILRFEGSDEQSFKKFINWISSSVSAQSRSVSASETTGVSLAKPDDEILSKVDLNKNAVGQDEDFALLVGKCQKRKLPYLMRFEREKQHIQTSNFNLNIGKYHITSVIPLTKEFDELSAEGEYSQTINSDYLVGNPSCPHCGAMFALATCACGQIFCIQGEGVAHCPGCDRDINMGYSDESFDINRSRG